MLQFFSRNLLFIKSVKRSFSQKWKIRIAKNFSERLKRNISENGVHKAIHKHAYVNTFT